MRADTRRDILSLLTTNFYIMPRKKKEEPELTPEDKKELEWVKKLWDLKNGIRTEKVESLEDILD